MTQYRQACLISPPLEAPWHPPFNIDQLWGLLRQTSGVCDGEHHWQDGGFRRATTDGGSGAQRNWIFQPPKLAAEVLVCKYRATKDYWRVWGLDGQQITTLGGLQRAGFWVPHMPQQVPWLTSSWSEWDLLMDDHKVRVSSDEGGGQGGLQYGSTLQGVGIRDRGGVSRGAAPLTAAGPGVGLKVSPHWRTQWVQWGEPHSHAMGSALRVAQWCTVLI